MTIAVHAETWSWRDGRHVNAPTRDLILSPRLFTITAHGGQVLRTMLRRPPDATRELTYRIVLQERLPAPAAAGSVERLAFRMALPVFVAPAGVTPASDLAWSARALPDGRLRVTLLNAGHVHVQVTDFALYAVGTEGATQLVAGESVSTILLGGERRE